MKIEFIISHYKGRTYQLLSTVSSIVAQSSPFWKIHIVCDGVVEDISYIQSVFPNFPIRYSTLDKNYNDWGHTPKNFGIKNSTEEWLVLSGNDNYYVPVFVEKVLDSISKNPNLKFVYFDMVHSHYNYSFFKCRPFINQIDIGSFVSLARFAKEILLDPKLYYADGVFVENYVKKFCKEDEICYLPCVYYVHN